MSATQIPDSVQPQLHWLHGTFLYQNPRKLIFALLWLFTFAFTSLLLSPIVNGRMYTFNDLADFFLPTRYIYWKALHSGDSLIYTSQLFGGFYLQGEGQLGSFHPLHLLLYSTLPFLTAFTLHMTLVLLVFFAGTYVFLRTWPLSKGAAFFGAVAFIFGSTPLLKFYHVPPIEGLCHIPWMLVAMRRMFLEHRTGHRSLWLCVLTAITASQSLVGYPATTYLSLILEGWYLLLLSTRNSIFSNSFWYGTAKLFGAILAITQLLPTWVMASQSSNRAFRTFEFLAYQSFHPANLLQWVNPFFNIGLRWEQDIYVGTGVLLLAVWGGCQKPATTTESKRRKLLLALAATCLFLGFGEFNILYKFYYQMPLMNMFRVPARHLLFVVLPIVIFAAASFEQFCDVHRWPSNLRPMKLAAWALILGSAVLLAVRLGVPGLFPVLRVDALKFPERAIVGSIMVMSSAAIFLAASRGNVLARIAFLFLVVLEPLGYHLAYLAHQSRETLINPEIAGVEDDPPVPRPGPVSFFGNSNHSILSGYRYISAYAAFHPKRISTISRHDCLNCLEWPRQLTGKVGKKNPTGRRIVCDSLPMSAIRPTPVTTCCR